MRARQQIPWADSRSEVLRTSFPVNHLPVIQCSMFSLILPPSISRPSQNSTVDCPRSVVIVGANGCGKTRLGAWIDLESPQFQSVHRIAAQKSLALPERSSPTSLEAAESDF